MAKKATASAAAWSESVGYLPHKVTVYEDPKRGGVLYVRWRAEGNWKVRSLKRTLRDARGRIDVETQRWARQEAVRWNAALIAGPIEDEPAEPAHLLEIGETRARLTDPTTGKYPADTAHRREVLRALDVALTVWGSHTSWASIRRVDLRKLWRFRIRQLAHDGRVGVRGAEVTASRIFTIAAWLRDEELIPATACVPSRNWKQELRDDWTLIREEHRQPKPSRPRHTVDEVRRILAKAPLVDPRFALLFALGAELRLGQVARCRRSDLDLAKDVLVVPTNRHKRGAVVHLTDGQRSAVDVALAGYLTELEDAYQRHGWDYQLFPGGQMPGGRRGQGRATLNRHGKADPIDRTAIRKWFRRAEMLAEVKHVKGRGAYGGRRAMVDGAKAAKISRDALKEHGGWSDMQMPDQIYADEEQLFARDEARDVRARIRGEVSATGAERTDAVQLLNTDAESSAPASEKSVGKT